MTRSLGTICLTLTLLLGSSGVSVALPPCPEKRHPTTSPWLNCFGTYTFASGEKYVGEYRNDKEHGQGTYTYVSGDKYVGEFRNGKRNGQGTFTFASGNKYVGEYRDNKRNGQGTFTFANGNKYVGESKGSKFHGQGTLTFASGNKYVGEWRDGKQHRQGTVTFANGDKYVGESKGSKFHGQGTLTFADGRVKEGIWKEGKFQYAQKAAPPVIALPVCEGSPLEITSPSEFAEWDNCKGTFIVDSSVSQYAGDRYVGEFRDGKQNGQGAYTFADGNKYVGEFRDSKKHGQGTYTFADGNKYVGEFRDSKKHGQGTYTYVSGDKYVGEFRNGKQNGQGTYTYVSGNKYVGEYRDGKRNGQGTFTFANGNKYVGEFKNDKQNGQGISTFASGSKYVGEYRDGKKHGQGTYTFASGRIEEGIWKEGKFQYAQKAAPPVIARKSPSPTRLELARRTQEALQVLGLYSGKLDGIIGVKTKSGIQRWQKRNGYAGTGEVTEAQLIKLEQEAITRLAEKQSEPKVAEKKKPPPRSDPNKVISASSGSGFAVSSDGHVITNHHVIEGCQNVKIHHDGKSIPARVVTFDPRNDLALLKGDFRPSTVLPLSTNSPELMQDVYVAGYPFGRKISTAVKVTRGIISSLTGIGNNYANIQIDASLQPGNSGGPILDDKGNVVGVAVGTLDKIKTLKKLGSLPENTNFGIKANMVRSILESSNVSVPRANEASISKTKLGRMISGGTYYLSCWMTTAQIEKMRSKKVIFQNRD